MNLDKETELRKVILKSYLEAIDVPINTTRGFIEHMIYRTVTSFTVDGKELEDEINFAAKRMKELIDFKGFSFIEDIRDELARAVFEYQETQKKSHLCPEDMGMHHELSMEMFNNLCVGRDPEYVISNILKFDEKKFPKYFLLTKEGWRQTPVHLIGMFSKNYPKKEFIFRRQENETTASTDMTVRYINHKGVTEFRIMY